MLFIFVNEFIYSSEFIVGLTERQSATRRAVAAGRFRGGSAPARSMDRLRPTVPRSPRRPAQAPESLAFHQSVTIDVIWGDRKHRPS